MKNLLRRRIGIVLCLALFLFSSLSASAFYAGFSEVSSCPAYRQFAVRPATELSKIIYLIDRFANEKIEVLYDGNYYSAPFAAKVARWFLSRRYSKENAQAWVLKWCNASTPAGNLIWVKMPDGEFVLAREMLLTELQRLQEELAKNPAK